MSERGLEIAGLVFDLIRVRKPVHGLWSRAAGFQNVASNTIMDGKTASELHNLNQSHLIVM